MVNESQNADFTVQIAREKQRSIEHLETAQTMAWLPNIHGHFIYSYANNIAFTNTNLQWRGNLQLKWKIWEGKRIFEHQENAIQLAIAKLNVSQHQNDVQEQAKDQWERMMLAKEAVNEVQWEKWGKR